MMWDGIALFSGAPVRRSADGVLGAAGVPPLREPERPRRAKVGLALGGGAARGWSHIGAIEVLQEAGIPIDVVAGCSIGAAVGACHAAGKLGELRDFAVSLTKRRVMGLLDFHISGSGLIAGERLRRLLERDLGASRIEDLPLTFAAVATELGTGHEIWLTRGGLVEAVRASYALPGIFDPVKIAGRWLMDGALVNPVPVTAARALGADVVLCVNLNGDMRVRGTVIQSHGAEGADAVMEAAAEAAGAMPEEPRRWPLIGGRRNKPKSQPKPRPEAGAPSGIASVMVDAFNITQDRISRSRLAGDPPDVMINPKLAQMGLFEFHRAEECIELGRQATRRLLPEIHEMIAAAVTPA
ncbi:patatin-like phospholipase family protein [Methylobacterium platani]|uniref:NTE family protein rssA n=2 Tax=Methylobacterium platani TaxID=427683 RepID=A0A179SDM7_9HYPH|nr:patatin-like phospholipase family protein [Methylobacterium platani]KMO22246.1 NTE family protein rssA [Methylobacterium platani JCM 14648]OAS24589.1 NTE family protein rssA [Methylobacterium platani]